MELIAACHWTSSSVLPMLYLVLLWIYALVLCCGNAPEYSWKLINKEQADRLFTEAELLSAHDRQCNGTEACCLGSLSAGGAVYYNAKHCNPKIGSNNFMLRYVPQQLAVDELHLDTMTDVIRKL
eukprot:13710-Heterococcus_DN1.PRE.1